MFTLGDELLLRVLLLYTDMGWRVELRTMEVQLTDMENAAFTARILGILEISPLLLL